ncbi:hypothetical protein BS47DRAFT_854554 [Hydnum rufescens UP504]|uniref:Uncharacterized protein n=1 Tax=Hydnum rufescens UP504 TaxID=1448309 RepID=A0A9P6B0B1_9AGAM|nr:hypothetical protein BS47DRAFT_854554 [Hydnum rufescens UP504]
MPTSSIPYPVEEVNITHIPESASSQTETCKIPTQRNSISFEPVSSLPAPSTWCCETGIFPSSHYWYYKDCDCYS